jgi:UDP-N-acetylglucosamine 2-epimerase (non-hydrolysing)/GDP/UDP-N,N'-diacetylbacillosamine 2-epimerase (hydrolysing)
MGESPERVFNFGAPGLDSIYRTRLLTKRQLERSLGFRLKAPISMVTYHPVTLDSGDRRTELENILDAITSSKLLAIFTQANADPRGRMINERLRLFCARAPERFHLCQNMGQIGYLSALKYVNLMIGNSSSGLTEAPSFKVPVVNIGDRQKGRMKGANVIDSGTSFAQVKEAIATALSKDFTESLRNSPNPYDKHQDGRTSYRIKEVLKGIELGDHLLKKEFRDLDFSCQS